jgi:hypothetical protein
MRVTLDRTVAAITNPNLIAMMIFAVIGCLIELIVVFRFLDLGLRVEQLNPFAGPWLSTRLDRAISASY